MQKQKVDNRIYTVLTGNRSRGAAFFRIVFRGCRGKKLAEINSLLAINEDNFEVYAPLNHILRGIDPRDRLP